MMRKRLIVAWVLALSVSLVSQPTFAQDLLPHEDPASAPTEFSALGVIAFISDAVLFLEAGQNEDFQSRLALLEFANIPAQFRDLIDRYGSLLQNLGEVLDAADHSITTATAAYNQSESLRAFQHLDDAGDSLDQARRFLDELSTATTAIERGFGAIAAIGVDELEAANQRLGSLVERLNSLWERLALSRSALEDAIITTEPEPESVPDPAGAPPFYSLLLELTAPDSAYPGLPFTVSGSATALDGPSLDTVSYRLSLGSTLLEEFTEQLTFDREVTIPEGVGSGLHTLTLEFPEQQAYDQAVTGRGLKVVLAPVTMSVRSDFFGFQPRSLKVSGFVDSDFGPVGQASVVVELSGSRAQAVTDESGEFLATVQLPFLESLGGMHETVVIVDPVEPWIENVRDDARIFSVNAANLTLLALALAFIGATLFVGRRTRRSAPNVGTPDSVEAQNDGLIARRAAPSMLNAAPQNILDTASEAQRRIVSLYYRAARVLTERLNIPFDQQQTLREFLRSLGRQSPQSFSTLTDLAEVALYASRQPSDSDVDQALELAATLDREESGTTPH